MADQKQQIYSTESEALEGLIPPEGLVWEQFDSNCENLLGPQLAEHQEYHQTYTHDPHANYEIRGKCSPGSSNVPQNHDLAADSAAKFATYDENLPDSCNINKTHVENKPRSQVSVYYKEPLPPFLNEENSEVVVGSKEDNPTLTKLEQQQCTASPNLHSHRAREFNLQDTRDVKDKARYSPAEDLLINRCRRELELSWQEVTEVLRRYDPNLASIRTKGSLQVHYSQRLSKQEFNIEALDVSEVNHFKKIFENNISEMILAIKNESDLVLRNKQVSLNLTKFLNCKLQQDKIRMENALEQVYRMKKVKRKHLCKSSGQT